MSAEEAVYRMVATSRSRFLRWSYRLLATPHRLETFHDGGSCCIITRMRRIGVSAVLLGCLVITGCLGEVLLVRASKNDLEISTDQNICRIALTNNSTWDSRYGNYVQEAKRRGFTQENCVELSTERSLKNITVSDREICQNATFFRPGDGPPRWDTRNPNFAESIKMAKGRGLTPIQCAELAWPHLMAQANAPPSPGTQSGTLTALAAAKKELAEIERKLVEESRKVAQAERRRQTEEVRLAVEAKRRREEEQARLDAAVDRKRLEEQARLDAQQTAAQADPYRDIDFGKYYALVVGNDSYQHIADLQTAVFDAKEVADVLQNRYGFEVELLLNATRDDVFRSLGKLRRKLTEDDNLLIYYAGHGVVDEDVGRGYWLPVDADEDFKARWISNADLSDTLKGMDAWHVIVVADSCYSGTLIRSAQPVVQLGGDRVKLIERLALKKSRTVLSSGGAEPVVDSGGGGHSVFAKAFLDVLRENTEVLETQRLFASLRTKVIVNADQTPEYADVRKAGHDGGDFLFVPR